MASSLALKRLVSFSNLLPCYLRSTRPVAPLLQTATRLFNTDALRHPDDEDDRSSDVDRRSDRFLYRRHDFPPHPFSVVFDPFTSTRNLGQTLNSFDQIIDSRAIGGAGGLRRGWEAKETDDALYLRLEVPGLGKEHVKVSVEQNTLTVKGEGEKESDEEESRRRFSSRIDLPEKLYKTGEIKAEVKNGVLKVVVPKVKEDERSDVFHVKID